MSLLNFTARLFKRDDQGRTVVYPSGVMGRGYIVPDAAAEEKLRRALGWLYMASFTFCLVVMRFMVAAFGNVLFWTTKTWVIALVATAAYALVFQMVAKRLTRGMVLV